MKKTGLLAAISSLSGKYGVGDLGEGAYLFVDWLSKSKVKVWQILPLHPLGYGNSPYQSSSTYAADEIYIDLGQLKEIGLLKQVPFFDFKSSKCTFEKTRKLKEKYLRKAFEAFMDSGELKNEFECFKQDSFWLSQYAEYVMLKKENHFKSWDKWEVFVVDDKQVEYVKFVQFIFFKQWFKLKAYANDKGIEIMGDMPIYVGYDSSDVYYGKENFLLDENNQPTFIAGVPPDYFSETGQRWGNPIYDWEYMKHTQFKFWIDRLNWANQIYDRVRIDHFRAFDTYWKIPAECKTAELGEWVEAPGYALLNEVYDKIPNIHIMVEDLGELRDEVIQLKDAYNLAGMKVIQFESDANPVFKENSILYTGTHDNQTLKGWIKSLSIERKDVVLNYTCKYVDESLSNKVIKYCLDSDANLVVIALQDVLDLDDSARMNTPSTVNDVNWTWKIKSVKQLYVVLNKLKEWIDKSNRG